MKKLVITTALALACVSAHAWEVGARGSYDWQSGGANLGGGGITVSTAAALPLVGATRVSVEATRVGDNPSGVNQYALVATKDLVKLPLNVTLGARAGVAYVDPVGEDRTAGAAGLVGLVASMPVTKTVAVEAGLDRRFVENKTGLADSNIGFVGVRVSF